MRVELRETFLASVARLEGRSAAAVKRAAFDLLAGPARPGLRLHRLVHAVDRGFWSFRVNRELRIIVHRSRSDLSLCYADHHDRAYAWAEQRPLDSGASSALELDVRLPAPSTPRRTPPRLGPPAAAPPRPRADERAAASPRHRRAWRRAVAPLDGGTVRPRPASAPPPLLALLRLLCEEELAPAPRAASPLRPGGAARAPAPLPFRAVAVALAALAAAGAGALALVAGADPTATLDDALLVLGLALVPVALLAGLALLHQRTVRCAEAELARVAAALRSGALGTRCDPAAVDPRLWPLVAQADAAVEAATAPALDLSAALEALSRGEPPAGVDGLPEALRDQREALARLARFLTLDSGDLRQLAGATVARSPSDPRP